MCCQLVARHMHQPSNKMKLHQQVRCGDSVTPVLMLWDTNLIPSPAEVNTLHYSCILQTTHIKGSTDATPINIPLLPSSWLLIPQLKPTMEIPTPQFPFPSVLTPCTCIPSGPPVTTYHTALSPTPTGTSSEAPSSQRCSTSGASSTSTSCRQHLPELSYKWPIVTQGTPGHCVLAVEVPGVWRREDIEVHMDMGRIQLCVPKRFQPLCVKLGRYEVVVEHEERLEVGVNSTFYLDFRTRLADPVEGKWNKLIYVIWAGSGRCMWELTAALLDQ